MLLFKFDRIYARGAQVIAAVGEGEGSSGSADAKLPTAILYGELGTAQHSAWHEKLKQLALDAALTYVHRHYFSVRRRSALLCSATITTRSMSMSMNAM